MAVLVPEFSVTDWARSRAFYTGVLGFTVRYERPEEGFSYLDLGGAELMIDQLGLGRDFDAAPTYPFGRGMNLQIEVPDAAGLAARVLAAGHRLHLPLEDRWYRLGGTGPGDAETAGQDGGVQEVGNRQFILADPDGYLLRFFSDLGQRPA